MFKKQFSEVEDACALAYPFAGSRMLRGLLALQGCKIGRRHVKALMRMTKPKPGHKIYPYLLRGMEITRLNQVWAMDITYIPMARGFVYLAVVLDWATRRVLSWGCQSRWRRPSASRLWRMLWPVTASPASSTLIKARSSPVRPSPACSPIVRRQRP